MKMKKPFNTYTNRNGQTLPKSATIPSSPEILNWLKETFHFSWANYGKLIDESKPYIIIGISASHQGYIYLYISTCDEREISMYDPHMIKDFTDEEAFKKYLNWASKFPKKLVNENLIKHETNS